MADMIATIGRPPVDVHFGENTVGAMAARTEAAASAAAAALSEATAESSAGPTYASTGDGLAATTDGQSFAVDNGNGTVTIYLNDSGSAVEQRTLATTAALASPSGGEMVGFGQDIDDADTRDLMVKSRERLSVEDVALSAASNTGRRARLQSAVDGASSRELAVALTYTTSAGAQHTNPATSDPDPAAVYITGSDQFINGEGGGSVIVDTPDKSVFHVRNAAEADRPKNVVIRDFAALGQPPTALAHSGLADDYFTARIEATENCGLDNITFAPCELAFTFQFAQTVAYAQANVFDAAAAVSAANNTIAIIAHDFATGDAAGLSPKNGGTIPTGLAAGVKYYAIKIDANTIKLAATKADALAGTAVDITAAGSGNVVAWRHTRSGRRNFAHNIYAPTVHYMFAQIFGQQGGTFSNCRSVGVAADGVSRAAAHGLRLTGYEFAPCESNRFTNWVVERFANGLALMTFVRGNTIQITAIDCQNGAGVTRQVDSVGVLAFGDYTAAAATAQSNRIDLTVRGASAYGISDDGGSYNDWTVDISDTVTAAILLSNGGGTTGLSTGNSFRGKIRRPGARGADIRGPDTTVDLDIVGNGIGTTAFGLLCSASGLKGRVSVEGATVGVQLSAGADGALLDVKVKSGATTTALVIAANDCVVTCDIDGPVSVSGNNNTLLGRINGAITNSGTGNDLRGVNKSASGTLTDTTDASGFLTVTHSLGRVPTFVSIATQDNANRAFSVTAKTTTTCTVRVWSGSAAPLASTATTFMWEAR